jgi:uncharacterized protein YjbI with pentapeptide repeats
MANEEHLEILNQGVDVWNSWRENSKLIEPYLSGADLKGASLMKVNFNKAFLKRARFIGADLRGADLRGSVLSGADLTGANLSEAEINGAFLIQAVLDGTNLNGSDLRGAYLSKADLSRANLGGADLSGADLVESTLSKTRLSKTRFSSTIIRDTNLVDVNLSEAEGLESVYHRGASPIGLDTIFLSKGKIPEVFLRGCGLSDLQIEFAKLAKPGLDRELVTQIGYDMVNLYSGQGLQFYSCFISYNSQDQAFAQKLHDDLQDNGVRCWFAPEDMKIGDRIRPRIDEEIRLRDKLLVILSENSIDSEWVGDEVEAALEEERTSDRTILFPVRLDDAVLEARSNWAAKIKRRRHIGDFSGWVDEGKYHEGFERLLRDLKAESGELDESVSTLTA